MSAWVAKSYRIVLRIGIPVLAQDIRKPSRIGVLTGEGSCLHVVVSCPQVLDARICVGVFCVIPIVLISVSDLCRASCGGCTGIPGGIHGIGCSRAAHRISIAGVFSAAYKVCHASGSRVVISSGAYGSDACVHTL